MSLLLKDLDFVAGDAAARRMPPLGRNKLVWSSAKPFGLCRHRCSRSGRAHPCPTSPRSDAWKQSLLKARRIAYTDPAVFGPDPRWATSSLPTCSRRWASPPKLKAEDRAGERRARRARSLRKRREADIAMGPSSELLAVPDTVLVGRIPLEVKY